MPASHNAASYSIKNFIMIVKNYVACQDLTIYDQLRAGIRVLDLRIACFQPTKSSPIQFWCAHTFLTVPLISVLDDIRVFMHENPSESVWILLTPDYSPINADYLGIANLKRKNREKISKASWEQLISIAESVDQMMGGENNYWLHRDKITQSTKIGELRGKVVCFVTGKQYHTDPQTFQEESE